MYPPVILISDYDEEPKKEDKSDGDNNIEVTRGRTVHVKSILKKSSIESTHSSKDIVICENVINQQPRIRKKSVFKNSKLRVEVYEQLYDENNNNDDEFKPNCWYKFLSVICAWRVRIKRFYKNFFNVVRLVWA